MERLGDRGLILKKHEFDQIVSQNWELWSWAFGILICNSGGHESDYNPNLTSLERTQRPRSRDGIQRRIIFPDQEGLNRFIDGVGALTPPITLK